jgi:1-acyl-sn-glycerol-3-phosphate acyltransferase
MAEERNTRVTESPFTPSFYVLMTWLMATALRLFARWQVTGRANVPASGPLLVVSNHLNLADPPLLAASLPRRIRFMAKQELFDTRLAGFFIGLYGALPVRRDAGDLRALRTAGRLLDEGGVLGMFPEGHRSNGAGLLPAHPGTALLALRSGATILPVGITGSEQIRSARVLVQRPHISVTIGKPIKLDVPARISAAAVQTASDQIMRSIASLLPDTYRGAYTGREGA